jgi:hypothetical protein
MRRASSIADVCKIHFRRIAMSKASKPASRPAKSARSEARAPAATISVPPAETAAITRLLARIEALQPETAEDYLAIVEIVKDAKRRAKALNERRFEITRPQDAAKKSVMALFAAPVERCEVIESAGKKKILGFVSRVLAELPAKELAAQKAARRQALAELEAQIGKLEASGNAAVAARLRELADAQRMPLIVLPTGIPEVSGVSIRSRWKWRMVNPEAVPREYWAPEPAKIEKVVAALGPNAGIDGIEVWEEREVAITA